MHTQLSSKKRRLSWWLITAALIAALMVTTTAFADGEEPADPPEVESAAAETEAPPAEGAPAESPPEEAAPPPEESAPADEAAPPPEESAPAEEAAPPPEESTPAEEAAPPPEEDAPAEETAPPPAEEAAAGEAPAETEIVEAAAEAGAELVSASGEPIDLASTESAELLQSSDPYWFVGSTKYAVVFPDLGNPGANCPAGTVLGSTCWENDYPITTALDKIKDAGMLPTDRKLYVEAGTYDENVTINGSTYTNWKLMNGLIGVDGSENTTINGNINVTNNSGGFTLQGFTLNDGSYIQFDGNSGTVKLVDVVVDGSSSTYGIEVSNHAGSVSLDRVNASNNDYNGAAIDNTAGRYSVTVINSAFNHNGHFDATPNYGLKITSNYLVTLDGVAACDNLGDGIDVMDYSTLRVKNAYLTNNNDSGVDVWWGFGLYTETSRTGTAYLENVYANENEDGGIYINDGSLRAKEVWVENTTSGHGLYFQSLSGTGSAKVEYSRFSGNHLDGLHIETGGTIYLKSVGSSHNGGDGAYLDNSSGSGSVTITSYSSYGSQQANYFGRNDACGVNILSGGTVSITNVDMSNNGSIGLNVDNTYGARGVTVNATIKDYRNRFSENTNKGIDIQSYGTVSLSKIEARDNQDTGIYVNNKDALYARSVKLYDTEIDHNDGHGLHILSKGYVYIRSIQSTNNYGGSGMYLDNSYGTGSVTITSPSSYYYPTNYFAENRDQGAYIFSAGTVTITNVDMNNNGGLGLYLDNSNGIRKGVTINKTLRGWWNNFSNNGDMGVQILSNGTVSLSYINAWGNGGHGIWVDTDYYIKLSNVWAGANDGYGAYLYNKDASRPRYVTLKTTGFYNNDNHGLYVQSLGSITATGLCASGNSILNEILSSTAPISYYDLLGDSWVEDRYSFTGAIGNTFNLDLTSNDFDTHLELWAPSGALEDENDDFGGGTNSHIGTNLLENGTYTVVVRAHYQDDWESRGNYWFSLDDSSHTINPQTPEIIHGAWLVNDTGTSGVAIYSQAPTDWMWGSFFDMNTGNGLWIESDGTIYLRSISASRNYDYGLYLNNDTSTKSVTVKNTRRDDFNSSFDDNGETGIFVRTGGSITLYNVDAWRNGDCGADLDNCLDSGGVCQGFGSISVLASYNRGNGFSENNDFGLHARSHGSIKLVNTYAADNQNSGASLKNDYDGSIGYIKVYTYGSQAWNNFERNGSDGLLAYSKGTISLSKVNCRQNTHNGAYLDNSGSPYVRTISIYKSDFNENDLTGLTALSKGSITFNYGGAENNGDMGAFLDNSGAGGSGSVTVKGSSSNNMSFSRNGWGPSTDESGLYVLSNGSITLRYISAHENEDYGVYLDNSTADPLPKTVYVKAADLWNNDNTGLYVRSKGSIYVYGINSRENGGDGANLDNSTGSGNVTVSTTSGWSTNDFWNNGYSGLDIGSTGTVYLKNIYSSENTSGYGIYVDNTAGTGKVTIYNTGRQYWLWNNGAYGLYIESRGKVYIYNQYGLGAGDNGSGGIFIDNSSAPIPSYVKLYRVDASNNGSGDGIEVHASGYIYTYSLTAYNNHGGDGADLWSDYGNITVTGRNIFHDNGWNGLRTKGHGAISIQQADSRHNGHAGIEAVTDGGNITLKYATASHNGYNGFTLESPGDFYLYKVIGYFNGHAASSTDDDNGLYINAGLVGSNVTIKYSSFMMNNGNGIEIVHPDSSFWPYLYKTSYLSNGDTDLYVH